MMYRYSLQEILKHRPLTKSLYIELLRKTRLITLKEEDYLYPVIQSEEQKIEFAREDQRKINAFLNGSYFRRMYSHINDDTEFLEKMSRSRAVWNHASIECGRQGMTVYIRVDSSYWRNADSTLNRQRVCVDPVVITTEPLSFMRNDIDVELLI